MKFIEDRKCPCCSSVVTLKEFHKFCEKNSGDDGREAVLFSCPKCDQIILSTRELHTWYGSLDLLALVIITISILIFNFYTQTLYIILFGVLIFWSFFRHNFIFYFLHLRCYTNKDITRIKNESSLNIVVLLLIVLLFFGCIFGIFYFLATYKI